MNPTEAQIAAVLPDVFDDSPLVTATRDLADDLIPDGQRNSRLTQVAGRLRRLGFHAETIAAALHAENRRRCTPPLDSREVDTIAASVERYAPAVPMTPAPALIGFTLDHLLSHVFPERKAIFSRGDSVVFREGHLGEIYAERGVGKTWLVETLALVAATGSSALGFQSAGPCRVLNVDGEMASQEKQDRYRLLSERMGVPITPLLTVVGADWQDQFLPRLDTDAGQVAIEPFIDAADLIILDNRSCLFDPEGEKDPTAWQPAQDWLLSLRRRGKAVLLAHHSNRQGGARGHSKPEDAMNLLIKLTRPEGYTQDQGARFLVTFEKSRGAYGAAVAPFLAHLTSSGWTVGSATTHHEASVTDKLTEYVTLAHQAGERPKSANAAIRGAQVNRSAGLKAWAELVRAGSIRQHHEGGWFCGR